ncbi:hypothetical protein [Paenibacillus sp. NPDC058071]|uniref:hypothetical protein n=1 Tax=Paenibacillus sp. NPDC058071 TaxID=3346326 RepID=UPI0036D9AEF8
MREVINLLSEKEIKEQSIHQRTRVGEIDNEAYGKFSCSEQEMARKALLEQHSQPVDLPAALSALEFTVFGLAKILFKLTSGEPLSEAEKAYIGRFQEYVEQHETTMEADDWRIPYAESNMLTAKANRENYKQKKKQLTGAEK